MSAVARDQLRAFVERIERLEEEKQAIADDIKEVYAEAKGNGFDTKVLRQVIRLRKADKAEREQFEALLHLYLVALGMLPDDVAPDGEDGAAEVAAADAAAARKSRRKPPVDDPVGFELGEGE